MTAQLEQAIIGLALTADPQVMLDLDRVRPEHFADIRHGALWALIRKVAQQHAPDPLTVAGALPSIPAEDRNGINDGYLLDCLHEAPAAPRVLAASYAGQLIADAGHRRLEAAVTRAHQLLEGTPDPVEADALIRAVLDDAAPTSQTVGHLIADTLDQTLDSIGKPGRVTPTPWVDLNQLLGGWRPGALYVVGARPATGKALALDTPIPTPTGWTTMGAINVGDSVLSLDGKPTLVTHATEVMTGHDCYRVTFSDGAQIVADADHQWATETRASRKAACAAKRCPHTSPFAREQRRAYPCVVTTRELAATVRTKNGRSNHTLPDVLPLDLPDADLPLDPYVLGYWLGDGDSNGPVLTVWERDADHVRAALKRAGYFTTETSQSSCVRIRFSTTPIRRGGNHGDSGAARLRSLGVLHNKHIPATYLRASYAQRLDLLRGVLDSDGTVGKTGQVEHVTVNRPLADSIVELARTLGVRPTVTCKRVDGRNEEHSTAYLVHGMFRREHMTLARKADRLPVSRRNLHRLVTAVDPVESVPVRCIQVAAEDHLYLAGEHMVPTHNSILGLQAAYSLAHTGPVAISSLEMPEREVHTRLLAHAASVPIGHINGHGKPTDRDREQISRAASHLRSLPISIDDRSSSTVWDVATHARLFARHQHLAGVVIDYMQLMSTPRGDRRPRHEVVAEQSRQLKILAGELDCPVIALSQLNRQSEGRGDGRPNLADLRESGAIEQDADVVLLLHVPQEGGIPDEGRLEVAIAKNRHGPAGRITLQRSGATASLNDYSWQAPDGDL